LLEKIMSGETWRPVDAYLLPDYLNDLNACYDFEVRMRDESRLDYILCLWDVLELGNKFMGMNAAIALIMQTATAKQRCKAFVLTMTWGATNTELNKVTKQQEI